MSARLALAIALAAASAASVLSAVPAARSDGADAADTPFRARAWRPLFQGVELAEFAASIPRPIKGFAVRIDLTAPGVEFLATPGNGGRGGETDGRTVSTFLREFRLQAAFNAAPFTPVHKTEGQPQDVTGLHVSRGELVSREQAGFAALLLTRDNRARIGYPPFDLTGVWTAVGGFDVVLKGGRVVEPGDRDPHPRTAVGLSADGRALVWLVADGRQPRYSEGATTPEVGAWLRALGCWDGLNLDGGGTTTLAVEGADGAPRVLNRPVHVPFWPGVERVGGSQLGVYARPLPRK